VAVAAEQASLDLTLLLQTLAEQVELENNILYLDLQCFMLAVAVVAVEI
jgi:hypothetical protein